MRNNWGQNQRFAQPLDVEYVRLVRIEKKHVTLEFPTKTERIQRRHVLGIQASKHRITLPEWLVVRLGIGHGKIRRPREFLTFIQEPEEKANANTSLS